MENGRQQPVLETKIQPRHSFFSIDIKALKDGLTGRSDGHAKNEEKYYPDDGGPTVHKADAEQFTKQMKQTESIKDSIKELKQVMLGNFQNLLERGSKMEDLKDQSETLLRHSQIFKKRATTTRQSLWYKSMSLKVILFIVLVVLGCGIICKKY